MLETTLLSIAQHTRQELTSDAPLTICDRLMSADLINLGPMGRTLQADERLYRIRFVEKAPSRTFLPAED